MSTTPETVLFAALFAVLLGYGAVSDVRAFMIPNWVWAGFIVLFIAFVLLLKPSLSVRAHVIVAVVAFAVTFGFYLMGGFGAGDVKLIAALMLWAGPENGALFIFVLAIAGGVFSSALLVLQKALNRYPAALSAGKFRRLGAWARHGVCPYGVPIVIAGFWILPRLFGLS